MRKKKKSPYGNLHKFFHYHEGAWSDRAVKIGASFLAAVMLLIFAGAVRAEKSLAERSYFLSMLVPELAFPVAAATPAEIITASVQAEIQSTPAETTPPESIPAPAPPDDKSDQAAMISDIVPEANEEEDRQNALQERQNVLREISDQKRELRRTCNQLKRMKNVAEDLAACNELNGVVLQSERRLKSWDGVDVAELREMMDDHRDLQVLETLDVLRAKIYLPQELNRFFKDLVRLEKVLKQKWVEKIPGLNLSAIQSKVGEIKNLHAEAKACYTALDLECAQEKLNEAREDNYPGDLEGPLHQLRDIHNMVRQIKDNDVKTEVLAILQPSLDLMNEGEWREGGMDISNFSEELRLVLQKILQAQQNRRALSSDVTNRLNRLIEKQGGNGFGDNGE